jgi:ankyrin repeat protein
MIFLESPNPFSKKNGALHQETLTEQSVRKSLRSAIIARDIGLLQSAIQAEGIDVNEVINHATGERLIHLAAKTTDCDFIITRFLIESMGAEPDVPDGYAMTPLLIAAEQANFSLVKYLTETHSANLHVKNNDGAGIAHLAA